MEKCEICPRNCGINRLKGELGFCRVGNRAVVSSYFPHFGEEKVLVGKNGSGTIFFTHCNLACNYCQNFDISQLGLGKKLDSKSLAEIMLDLQSEGVHNINLVTPTPHVPFILEALSFAIDKGLKLPLVYNTNAYDSVEVLKLLDGIIDIYLPDFKYADPKIAKKYSLASDYPQVAKKAILEMYRQVGDLIIENHLAVKGLLIRHLVLPNNLAGTKEIMNFIAKKISKNTFVNLMAQYRPYYKAFEDPNLRRPITEKEFIKALEFAKKAGLKRIYF